MSCHYNNVLCTTLGHYIYFVQPPSMLTLSQEEMCSLMVNELTTGCVDQPDVKCGFIGEVGSGWPLHGVYKKTAMEYTYFPNTFFILLHTSLASIFSYY
jgi:predicted metal-dependent phosphotriesterase family hydrolase